MKRKEFNTQISEMSEKELHEKLDELNLAIFNHRFTQKTGHVENPYEIRTLRKNIARVKTALTARSKAHV
jgi:large subunit ribosomal protein L29